MKRKAEQSSKSPDPITLALVSQFLSKHGFSSTLRIFTTERRKRLSSQKPTSTYGARETAGVPSLEVIVSNHLKKNPHPVKSEPAAIDGDSDSDEDASASSDSDSASSEDVKMGAGSDSESDGSQPESDLVAAPVPTPSRKRKAASSSSSDDDSTSDSSSSESEQEPPVKKAKVSAKVGTASNRRKSASSSSSESESESSASEGGSSSSEDSDDQDTAAKVVNKHLSNAVNTPLPPSDSSSSEDEEASDSSSSSSSSSGDENDSESDSDAENTPAPLLKPTNPVTNADESSESSGTIVGDLPGSRETKHHGAHPTRLAMLSATADMDDYISNTYVSYDYADRAYKDLSITRGKGFTKEKNKKKRGSYRGGTIDTAGGKAFKFDD